jgi:hypothetical protein
MEIASRVWGDNVLANHAISILDRAIPRAIDAGQLGIALALVVVAARLCLCQST